MHACVFVELCMRESNVRIILHLPLPDELVHKSWVWWSLGYCRADSQGISDGGKTKCSIPGGDQSLLTSSSLWST